MGNPPPAARPLPGIWKCPECAFVLFRRIIYARSGRIGEPEATSDVAEPCPNDGTLLVQETEAVH